MKTSEPSTTPSRPRRGRLRVWALFAVLAAALGSIPFVWTLVSTSDQRHSTAGAPERPVALVLGAGVRPDGEPSRMLSHRLDMAAELYLDESVHAVLVSGDNSVDHYNETDTMADYLVDSGVSEEHVVTDYAGFSTWDSCARAAEVFGVSEATVITQDFHLPRAVRLCNTAGIDTVGVGESLFEERSWGTVYGWAREVPAALSATLTVLFTPEPTHLGEYETGVDDALAVDRP